MDYKQKLNDLLLMCAKQDASDLHLAVGRYPTLRIDGALVPLTKEPILTPQDTEGLVLALLNEQQKGELALKRQVDFSYSFEDKARFRVNAYYQRGYLAAALRLIPAKIRTIEELRLPPILHDFVQDKSIVSQREVHSDASNFSQALRSLLRQDPDVIMIGEMRDNESIATALTAAETGHLVLSTLHTNSASQTIDRIIDSFPAEQQNQIASQLAATLVGIVSERLIPRIEGGRVPACEIMIANPAIRNLIRERKTYQIDLVIETNAQEGMITLNRSLAELVRQREISLENAEMYSLNPSELRILLEK